MTIQAESAPGPAEPRWRAEQRGPADPAVQEMLQGYMSELFALVADFDPGRAAPPSPGDFEWPNGCFLLVLDGDDTIACGALRRRSGDSGELRRMWVKPAWRGRGVGRYLLEALEDLARQMGLTELRLDTNEELVAALGLYTSAGYLEVPRYNDNDFADYWLAKQL